MNEYKRIGTIRQAGAEWVAQGHYWLFGTLTYRNGAAVTLNQATRDAKHFFNILDRQILNRRAYNAGRRLQRLVFVEQGRTRTNRHIHYYIKGTHWQHYRQIWTASEQIWTKRIERARDCVIKCNLEDAQARRGYCWKEFDALDSTVLLTECCH
jgi:hypothetical protein